MTEPVEFKNKLGTSRWQPRLRDGDRLWWGWTLFGDRILSWRDQADRDQPNPVLTSRCRAIRLARREQKRRDRIEYRETYKEGS